MNKNHLRTKDYGLHNLSSVNLKLINNSIKKKYVTNDSYCREFELKIKKKTNAKYCVVCNSGTSALFMSVLALNPLKPIAIVPNINFVSIANIIHLLKGQIILCDINLKDGMVGLQEFKDVIKKCNNFKIKPNLFIPVHYAGSTIDMKQISKICKKKNIKIVEDGCHSFGSKYSSNYKVGSSKHSLITTFSFHPLKNITTIEGGAITTNNHKIYKKILDLRSFSLKRTSIDDPYKMSTPSLNFRMGEINAAIGLDQISKINLFKNKRQKLVKYYIQKLKKYENFFSILNYNSPKIFWHLFVINFKNKFIRNKKEFMSYLKKNNIATQIHYKPLVLQKPLKNITLFNISKISKKFYKSQVTLPLHTKMTFKDIDYVDEKINKYFLKFR
tara:strand:+ start:518 stop:1678 length:1161 start_codon:yes stop_codon:yes gene_type:complete